MLTKDADADASADVVPTRVAEGWIQELAEIRQMVEFLVRRERKLDVKTDVAVRRLNLGVGGSLSQAATAQAQRNAGPPATVNPFFGNTSPLPAGQSFSSYSGRKLRKQPPWPTRR